MIAESFNKKMKDAGRKEGLEKMEQAFKEALAKQAGKADFEAQIADINSLIAEARRIAGNGAGR